MHNLKSIRERLGVTQQALATAIGRSQGNIGHYEKGQSLPPKVAEKLIAFAGTRGLTLTFDDVYRPISAKSKRARPARLSAGAEAKAGA